MTQIERIIKKIFPNRKVGKVSRYFSSSRPTVAICGCDCACDIEDDTRALDVLNAMYPPIILTPTIYDPNPTVDEIIDDSIDPTPSECGCDDEDRRCCSSSYNYDDSSSYDSSSDCSCDCGSDD